jgi:Family of unknown function (DUF6141)
MINFNETQRFKIKWAWLAVIAINGLFIYAIVQQVILGKSFGTRPAPDFVLILVEIFLLLLLLFIVSIKLKTVYTDEGIAYRFFPLQFKYKIIHWHELSDAYIREYNSLLEYGGWGIRYGSSKKGNAINTSASCNKGLQLQFKNGKQLLIGTKNPVALQQVVDEIMAAGKINRGI